MRPKKALLVMLGLLAVALIAPAAAFAQDAPPSAEQLKLELDNTWIIVSAILVIFMQAGFLFLEVGFSRGKNVGAGVSKILINLSIASIVWWAVGYGIAFGGGNSLFGTSGFFFSHGGTIAEGATAAGPDAAFMLFQFAFCAVSVAIVWGTTLERIKFGAYVVYAIVFSAVIYPLIAHWIFGGGLLADVGGKPVMDFAGSTVVHLTGATGGLAALLLLGPRLGKYGKEGPRALPGHSMPIVGLGILILWVGWFGFNAGSALGTTDVAFAEVALNTQLAAAAGVVFAALTVWMRTGSVDVGMSGNGAIAGLVGITAPSGFVEFWAAPIIGAVAGTLVVMAVLAIEKVLDDPVGALSAHGLAGIWGTVSVGIFGSERLILDGANPGLVYGLADGISQFGVQVLGVLLAFVVVFALSFAVFFVIRATIGLRVTEEEELLGLDIAEHGMYGYPEQFIPQPEFPGAAPTPHVAGTPVASPSNVTAATSS
jgi:ammonium transporter, Amt family